MSDDKPNQQFNFNGPIGNANFGDQTIHGGIHQTFNSGQQQQHSAVQPNAGSDIHAHLFISYKRAASADFVHALKMKLEQHITGQIFLDVHDIKAGFFDDQLNAALAKAQVFVLAIGPETFTHIKANGSADWVLREFVRAQTLQKTIIPVLHGGARHLPDDQLPPEFAGLSRYQSVTIRHDQFDGGVQLLVDYIRNAVT